MSKAAKTVKTEADSSSSKHAPVAKNAAGIEAQLGNRTTTALLESAAAGKGRPLESGVRKNMEASFGENFSGVRVHAPESIPKPVQAGTAGRHIVFGRGEYAPHSDRGRRLIAHELAHVVQQSKGSRTSALPGPAAHDPLERQADHAADAAMAGRRANIAAASTPAIQFRIHPEDAAPEMIGRTFDVTVAHTAAGVTLAAGDQVKIEKWDVDAEHSVQVEVLTGKAKGAKGLVLPEKILKPVSTAVAGIAPYSAGAGKQGKVVEKAETDLAAFQATKPATFKSKKQEAKFNKEETRQKALLKSRHDLLNRKEIQEAMYNRFDAVISREVAAANTAHGFTGSDALDPNLFKAQLFEESELGTSGEHMSVPATHPVKTRFNLGQVIDSSGMALFTLLEKEQPALVAKFHLADLRKDLAAAQAEKHRLEKKKKKRTPADNLRLQDLQEQSKQNWEHFIWTYKAAGQTTGFSDAVNDLFASGKPTPKNLDYEFWIHLAVMWLFEKKKPGKSWEAAIKAYNGSGARAEHYRAAIAARSADALASQAAGDEFIPTH